MPRSHPRLAKLSVHFELPSVLASWTSTRDRTACKMCALTIAVYLWKDYLQFAIRKSLLLRSSLFKSLPIRSLSLRSLFHSKDCLWKVEVYPVSRATNQQTARRNATLQVALIRLVSRPASPRSRPKVLNCDLFQLGIFQFENFQPYDLSTHWTVWQSLSGVSLTVYWDDRLEATCTQTFSLEGFHCKFQVLSIGFQARRYSLLLSSL